MTPAFSVRTDPHFERLVRSLRKRHPDFDGHFAKAVEILKTDPYNCSRAHPIKKLQGVRQGDGQYRLRSGRWRGELVFHHKHTRGTKADFKAGRGLSPVPVYVLAYFYRENLYRFR